MLEEKLRPYFGMAQEMSVEDGLLLRGSRIVIPSALQHDNLQKIHAGHMGIAKCRERARQGVWWPGLSKQLEQVVKNCEKCCRVQTQTAKPLQSSLLPELPFQKVGTDLFQWNGKEYLFFDNYYSRYIEVAQLSTTSSAVIIQHTKSIFARHGIPEVVVSDNGPQYASSAYKTFTREYGFTHITSSPLCPQGNGEAERAVKTVKHMLKKQGDSYVALLAYRATPLQNGFSPAELLMPRRLRTTVPATRKGLTPQTPNYQVVKERDRRQKSRQERNFNTRHRARDLTCLKNRGTVSRYLTVTQKERS